MPSEIKIIVTGPMGAGKTTAIRGVGNGTVVSTEVPMSQGTRGDKRSTTVGLDYGVCELSGGMVVKLFGTPGQERFAFMWDVLAAGAFGLIVLADNSQPDPIATAERYLDAFSPRVSLRRAVVGVGRLDTHPSPDLDDYARRLQRPGFTPPVVDVDVRRPADVRLLLSVLTSLAEVDACLAGSDSAP